MEAKRGIDLAVEAAGSQGKLAAQLGVTQQAVLRWVRLGFVPLRRAQEIEAAFGIPRARLADPRVLALFTGLESAL